MQQIYINEPRICLDWGYVGKIQAETHFGQGERRLAAAILATAVDDINASEPTRNSRDWFAEVGETDAFSFVGVCWTLGLDPAATRAELRKRQVRKPRIQVVF